MITTLYLLRHGETDGGDTKRYYGSIDIPLSQRGRNQISEKSRILEALIRQGRKAKYLSYLREVHNVGNRDEAAPGKTGLSAVYCSPLSRSAESASIVAAGHNLDPVSVHDLRERSFGQWEGMTFAEIREQHPSEFAAWAGDPASFSPIGGETTREVRDRAIRAIDRILLDHAGQDIAIVAHGGINRIILCHILGIPLSNIFRIEQDYAALNIIEFWENYPVLRLMNG